MQPMAIIKLKIKVKASKIKYIKIKSNEDSSNKQKNKEKPTNIGNSKTSFALKQNKTCLYINNTVIDVIVINTLLI